jgi:hypothetical protein
MNNTKLMIIAIGDELKSGFFLALQEECKVNFQKICETWDQYYEINDDKKKEKKKEKKNDDDNDEKKPTTKKPSGKKSTTIPQGKTSAISRSEQTPVLISAIEKLKVAELKNLNKERGLPISGNKAILTDALRIYEKNADDDAAEEEEVVNQNEEIEKEKKRKTSSKKKSEKDEETKTIVKKKKNEKAAAPVINLIKPEELKSYTDEYGNIVVADDLVCEEKDDGTLIVVAFKLDNDDNAVYALDTEHMEKCKELNLEFRIEEDEFEP